MEKPEPLLNSSSSSSSSSSSNPSVVDSTTANVTTPGTDSVTATGSETPISVVSVNASSSSNDKNSSIAPCIEEGLTDDVYHKSSISNDDSNSNTSLNIAGEVGDDNVGVDESSDGIIGRI